jgi:hypothetical protein
MVENANLTRLGLNCGNSTGKNQWENCGSEGVNVVWR